jgi:hypothetical protein
VQLLGFCCNSGAIGLQFDCNFAAIAVQLQLRLGETCCGWAGKNTRRKDALGKLAQWPGRSDLAVSRFPIFQHRLSHALNVPFLKGSVKGFF